MNERNSPYQRSPHGQVRHRKGDSSISRLNGSLHAISSQEEDGRSSIERSFSIFLIDSRPLTRRSVSDLIAHTMMGARVTATASPEEMLARVAEPGSEPNLIVFNIGTDTVEGEFRKNVAAVQDALPDVPIAVVADRSSTEDVAEALRQGVRGYIPTTLCPMVVIEALRLVSAGGTFVPATAFLQVMTGAAKPPPDEDPKAPEPSSGDLTPRQSGVLQLLQEGKSNKAIARQLNMQESTVKAHVRQLLKKLGARNRTQAVINAAKITRDERA